jgi:hypothetical protein
MLTRLIGDLYAWIIEIYLWFVVLISSVAGYHYTVPILKAAGLTLENQTAGKLLGAVVFAFVTFLVSAVAIGPIVVLLDIRKSVRTLETKSSGNGNRVPSAEKMEPFL